VQEIALEIVQEIERAIVQEIERAIVQAIEVVTVRARGIAPRLVVIVQRAEAIVPPRVVPRTPALRRAVPKAAAVPRLRIVVVAAAR
jgi:hypothetical protein